MSPDPRDPASPRGVIRLGHPLPTSLPHQAHVGAPVPVTVVGVDAEIRRRVVELLAGTPGVQVVGWAESVQALTMLGLSSQICLAVGPEPVRPSAADPDEAPPVGRCDGTRPHLSARQRDVLAAYAAGNELLDVVARRLGMGPETLKTHLRRIRAKYEAAGRSAPTRRDLYVRALEDGLVPPPTSTTCLVVPPTMYMGGPSLPLSRSDGRVPFATTPPAVTPGREAPSQSAFA